jgi:hypothetical protein
MTGLSRVLNPRAWSLSVKLSIALVLAALVPTILSVYLGIRGSLQQVENTAYDNLELLASSTGNRLDQLVNDSRYAAAQIAGSSDFIRMLSEPGNAEAMAAAELTALNTLNSNPAYEYVYAMDKDGLAVLSQQIEGSPTVKDQNFKDRAYFKEAIQGNQYVDVLVGRRSKALGFYFSSAVKNAKQEIIGVAIIKLKGEAITNIVNQFKVGATGYAFLIDQYGVIVSHPQKDLYYKSLVPLDKDIEEIVALRFVLGECAPNKLEACQVDVLNTPELGGAMVGAKAAGHVSYLWPFDGSRQIVGFAPMTTLGWIVGVDKPAEEFVAPLLSLAQQAILIVVVVCVVMAIIGVLLARSIARPMGKLAAAAVEIQNDRPFTPEQIADVRAQPDEVGNLARVFSNMVVALRARAAELHTIYDIGTKISSNIELNPTLTYLVNAINGIIPFDGAEVCLYDAQQKHLVRQIAANGRGLISTVERSYRLDGYLGHMVEKRAGLLIPDVSKFQMVDMGSERHWDGVQPRSYLGILLKTPTQIIGTVELVSTKPDAFTLDNQRILESIGIQAAVVVQNAREVEVRERNLRVQIEQLRIEIDEVKKAKQVAEITESSFFEELTRKAKEFRKSTPRKTEPR